MEEAECREPSKQQCADPVGGVFAANQNGIAVEDGAEHGSYRAEAVGTLACTRVYLLQPLGQRLAFVVALTPMCSQYVASYQTCDVPTCLNSERPCNLCIFKRGCQGQGTNFDPNLDLYQVLALGVKAVKALRPLATD